MPEEIAAFQMAIHADAVQGMRGRAGAGGGAGERQRAPLPRRAAAAADGGLQGEEEDQEHRQREDATLAAELQVRLFLADDAWDDTRLLLAGDAPLSPTSDELLDDMLGHRSVLVPPAHGAGMAEPRPLPARAPWAHEEELEDNWSDLRRSSQGMSARRGLGSAGAVDRHGAAGGWEEGGVGGGRGGAGVGGGGGGAGSRMAEVGGGGLEVEETDMSYERLLALDDGVARVGLKPAQLDKLARAAARFVD